MVLSVNRSRSALILYFSQTKTGGSYTTVRGNLLKIGDTYSWPIAGLGAGMSHYLSTKLEWKQNYNINYSWAYFIPDGDGLASLCDMAEEGKLVPNVAHVFKFDEFSKAFHLLDSRPIDPAVINSRASGKIVVKL